MMALKSCGRVQFDIPPLDAIWPAASCQRTTISKVPMRLSENATF